MKSLIERAIPASVEPLRFFVYAIKWVIAVMTLIGGVYLFTPLYQFSQSINGSTGFAATLSQPAIIYLWGLILVVGACLVIYGLIKDLPQIRSAGFFMIFSARFFQVLNTWITIGFLPISWIYPFTLMLITIILWGMARTEALSHGS